MKHLKTLGSLAVAAAALMVFAGTASATITAPAGTAYSGAFSATSTNNTLHFSVTVECKHSTLGATISEGATSGPVTNLSFTQCGTDTVTVLKNGTLSIASDGTVSLTGSEFTSTWHRTVLGFPLTTHCIYTFGNIGTLTEGATPPVIDIGSSQITRLPTDGACGETAVWTGSFTLSEPAGAITVD
jgi:hypothetical protein